MAFTMTKEEAARWERHINSVSRQHSHKGRPTSFSRKQKAISLYRKTGSKGYVCKEMGMSRHTLNKFLKAAGVV